jgi:hypothetical protein
MLGCLMWNGDWAGYCVDKGKREYIKLDTF